MKRFEVITMWERRICLLFSIRLEDFLPQTTLHYKHVRDGNGATPKLNLEGQPSQLNRSSLQYLFWSQIFPSTIGVGEALSPKLFGESDGGSYCRDSFISVQASSSGNYSTTATIQIKGEFYGALILYALSIKLLMSPLMTLVFHAPQSRSSMAQDSCCHQGFLFLASLIVLH